jgi:hypothetical protein
LRRPARTGAPLELPRRRRVLRLPIPLAAPKYAASSPSPSRVLRSPSPSREAASGQDELRRRELRRPLGMRSPCYARDSPRWRSTSTRIRWPRAPGRRTRPVAQTRLGGDGGRGREKAGEGGGRRRSSSPPQSSSGPPGKELPRRRTRSTRRRGTSTRCTTATSWCRA